jgi:hypothetical protein
MTAAEEKFRAEQNATAKDRLHADMAALRAGDQAAAKKPAADPQRLGGAEFVRRAHVYTMRPGETIDDVKSEGYFRLISSRFALGDKLEVRSADLTFYAELLVVASDHIAARVELRTLMEAKLEPAERNDFDADKYRIEDTGDVLKRLAVIRKADGKLMRDGFKTKQDAAHYITTELAVRAA